MDYPYEASVAVNAKFPLKPDARYHKVSSAVDRAACGVRLISRKRFKPIPCENTMGTAYFEGRRNDCRTCFPS